MLIQYRLYHPDIWPMLQQVPLSLYIHFPWCMRKCPYCDFNSHQIDEIPEQPYIEALLLDLEQDLPLVWGRRVNSVFIGGGTPSLMSGAGVDSLLAGLRARLSLAANAEITLEANPGTVEQARFRDYRNAGVNRLSLGVQSFNGHSLQRLGRIHDAASAHQAIETAKSAGFDNFNVDLMFALPGQSLDDALADVRQALQHQPTHLSYYQLTLEPNTRFYAFPPQLPDEDSAIDMQDQAQALMLAADYRQYEVSAYAKPGRESRHNLNYWQFGDYLGIGAGAHGKITDVAAQRITRIAKQRQPQRYMEARDTAARYQSLRHLTAEELPLEFMMNALRLNAGFAIEQYSQRTGLAFADIAEVINQCQQRGWLQLDAARDWLRITSHGQRFLNDVLQRFC